MNCILLVAGYATRLYPLTKYIPKSLLIVENKTILDHILEKIECLSEIKDIFLVSNSLFYMQFCSFVEKRKGIKPVQVINDGTTNNDNRLGAIADIQFGLNKLEEKSSKYPNNYDLNKNPYKNDLLVMAGDNLFDFDLREFVNFFIKKGTDCISTHELDNIEDLKRTGVIEVDNDFKIISFQEKPEYPKSKLAVPPFYLYKSDTLPMFRQYLEQGNNPDALGNFVPWLLKHKPIHAWGNLQGIDMILVRLKVMKKLNEFLNNR